MRTQTLAHGERRSPKPALNNVKEHLLRGLRQCCEPLELASSEIPTPRVLLADHRQLVEDAARKFRNEVEAGTVLHALGAVARAEHLVRAPLDLTYRRGTILKGVPMNGSGVQRAVLTQFREGPSAYLAEALDARGKELGPRVWLKLVDLKRDKPEVERH